MSSDPAIIPLGQMPQQAGIRAQKDDWTGIIDRTQRRKLQNRLNQRAFRLRRQFERQQHQQDTEPTDLVTRDSLYLGRSELQTGSKRTQCPPEMPELMLQLEAEASKSYSESSPNLDHLLSLPKINVQRAIIQNIHSTGMTMEWTKEDDAISIFNLQVPGFSDLHIPLDLLPTEVQKRVPHHPWLDFFPSPTLRDNLIVLQDEIDDEDLCHDLMAFWDTRNTRAGVLFNKMGISAIWLHCIVEEYQFLESTKRREAVDLEGVFYPATSFSSGIEKKKRNTPMRASSIILSQASM
ncbi:hypothetical protein PEBR_13574 [Penicillium brasilianum]|uniref:BZIP domain-containing protein n=1 Tax=Penicillium brasilianum TaxID=104259 RepID=A0A1S9RS64_PENBI|nr:hypothetical protein PEBR_13574 [Penicillium brasilianum]